MKKLLKHAWQILLGGMILFLFACVDLDNYPVMHYVDYLFWPMCVLFLFIALIYCWRHKTCFLLVILLLSNPVWAGEYTAEICSYYNSYKQRIENYKKNYFKQDEACNKVIWDKARKESEEYKISLMDVAMIGTSYLFKKGKEWYDGSCANDLMSMCSEYEKRHPEEVTKTVPVILNEAVGNKDSNGKATSCWPCDLAYVVFMVIQGLSNNLSGMIASICYMMLVFGSAFWLLFKAFGMVLTSKGGTYFSQIAGGLIGILIAAWLLSDGGKNLSWLYSKFLSPIMELGLTISEDIQSSTGTESAAFSSLMGSKKTFYKQLKEKSATKVRSQTDFADYCGYISSLSSSKDEKAADVFSSWYTKMSSQFFPNFGKNFQMLSAEAKAGKQTLLTDELRSQFLCMTQKFYNQSLPFIATGQSLVSFASHDTKAFLHFDTRLPKNMPMCLIGLLLIGLFTYFGFLVAFRIMDIFLRLGFILVLMPIFVLTTVFSITREYTLKAWTFLFGVIVEFIGLAISISFVMIMLESVLMPRSNELLEAMAADYSKDYGENLFKAITQNMTWTFLILLICVVIMGGRIMKSFPIIIASLFGVNDTSSKGTVGTMMGGTIGTWALQARAGYQGAKNAAQTAAKNPYKTKETKAKEAEKDLKEKKKKLEEEKKKPNNKKNIEKAQKDVDEAQKKADAFRAQADAEKDKTAPSQSGYAARRFGYDTGNAMRTGGASAAEAIEKFGSTVGNKLMKTGIGALAGVPIVLGAKAVSMGVRAGSKTAEVGLKAAGRAGATVQKWGNKITGKAPPPRKPKP